MQDLRPIMRTESLREVALRMLVAEKYALEEIAYGSYMRDTS